MSNVFVLIVDQNQLKAKKGKSNEDQQEIIRPVSEWVPFIGPKPKVIPPSLCLNMAPSSTEDVTRAMC